MAGFLSDEWFAELNAALADVRAPRPEGAPDVRVVFHLDGGPTSRPHAFTLALSAEGPSLSPGDHLAADLVARLSYEDGRRLADGELDATEALRDGRLKFRGDLNALNELGPWLAALRSGRSAR